jgi:KaiC/GvpD/RAD55 family RecA-like ATPase
VLQVERVKTGIPGFDDLVEGGFPKGSSILITGGAGTGKTIFGMQYIYEGAKLYNEPGLFVTLESNLKNVVWNMQSFNWDIKALQDKKLMKIYRLHLKPAPGSNFEDQVHAELRTISKIIKEMGIKRLVVDSTTAFGLWIKDLGMLRHVLFEFVDALKELDCTTVLIAETKGGRTDFSAFGVEEFVADAVVAVYLVPPHRSLFVRKMRGTKHSKKVHPFEITDNGLIVRSKDEILWQAIK